MFFSVYKTEAFKEKHRPTSHEAADFLNSTGGKATPGQAPFTDRGSGVICLLKLWLMFF